MNRFAYRTTSLAVKVLSNLSKAKVELHGTENIPKGTIIFVVNHFTRIETLLLPYHISRITGIPVWSLADYQLFVGAFGKFLDKVGAVSTKDPDRDLLCVKSLLTGEATWIIFPEGRMVKNKKLIEKGRFMISYAGGKHPPHTGAATLALRTEFYRQRLRKMEEISPGEASRLMGIFGIEDIEPVLAQTTYIVPVNITYYPIRARENILSNLAAYLVDDIPDRLVEEIMTEGTMLLSGVDVDIRFGQPIEVRQFMRDRKIERDIGLKQPIGFDDPIMSRSKMRRIALRIMQQYMEAIYSMTTVNHDHLFASALRLHPFRRIDEDDLKRRAFLAATQYIDDDGLCAHKSLKLSQVHLLTDDRAGKYQSFVSLAEEKGVEERRGGKLTKNTSGFADALEFHRIRIDNPIEVMANAIEPLTVLQNRLSRLRLLPQWRIRQKVKNSLLRQAISEFNRDYAQFHIEGESKSTDVGAPFIVKGKSRNVGVVLCHGYMAAPLEVRELAEYLGRMGFWVFAPQIRGHGTAPEDLATRSFSDWVESVDRGYAIISNICKRVVVGGFSNGGGLALDLAARIPGVNGVFAVCPAFRLMDLAAKLVPTVDRWNRFMDRLHMDSAKMEFVENNPEHPHINYFRNPISGVRELERLMQSLEPKLPDITVPALIIQASKDPVVNPKGSREVFDLLGSEEKAYTLFDFDRHGILSGEGAHKVHGAIGRFIEGLTERR